MKTTGLYDFTLTANGSQQIQADANFYKILTAIGDVSITRDGGSTVKPMRAGRGERNVDFLTLTIKDLSGAPNSGTILVGDSDFIDDTIVLSSAINVRPESSSGNWASSAQNAAGATQVFTPGSNAGGVILLAAAVQGYNSAGATTTTLIAKAGAAPTSMTDGDVLLAHTNLGAGNSPAQHLPSPLLIEAGKGLYVYNSFADNGWTPIKFARWKNL